MIGDHHEASKNKNDINSVQQLRVPFNASCDALKEAEISRDRN